jgi:hypothetical protein
MSDIVSSFAHTNTFYFENSCEYLLITSLIVIECLVGLGIKDIFMKASKAK